MKRIQEAHPKRILVALIALLLVGCNSLGPVSNLPALPETAPAPTSTTGTDVSPPPEQVQPQPTTQMPTPSPSTPLESGPVFTPATGPVPSLPDKVSLQAEAYFDFNKSTLKPAGKAQLDDLVSKMQRDSIERINLTGHTDSIGRPAYNQKLSEQRAASVKAYLVSKGIDANKITTSGKGESQPVASNKTADGRRKNNRVDITTVVLSPLGRVDVTKVGLQLPLDHAVIQRPNDRIPVFFATNRKSTGDDNSYFFYGNELADAPDAENLQRGIAVIKVPLNRKKGELKSPTWIRMQIERYSNGPLSNLIGISKITAANPDTDFSYDRGLEVLDATSFRERLKNAVVNSKSKTAVLYVHGFENTFNDAAFRTAQIVFDLATLDYDLVPLMFSWPSDPALYNAIGELIFSAATGSPVKAVIDVAVKAVIDVPAKIVTDARRRTEQSGYDLARFLKEIATETDINTVHIIAHSMGADVLSHAILKLGLSEMGKQGNNSARPVFRQIVFAAPAETPRIFEERIEPAIQTNHSITIYGSDKDVPLFGLELVEGQGSIGSVSYSKRLLKCVDIVDVTPVVGPRDLAHSTWAESQRVLDDLGMVFHYGLPPSERGLTKRQKLGQYLWELPLDAPEKMRNKAMRTSSLARPCGRGH
jgi:outer membrane protein OmpA-like peptidoglycan-associated protein/esterase/lipase superfamily enzyme